MHPHLDPLALIERRLTPAERQEAEAHAADCQACRAELAETHDLVEALEAIPSALQTLPWRPDRLWPAIRTRLQPRPAAYAAWRWSTGVSLLLLGVLFSGVWWGSGFNASPLATLSASYVAQPPVTLPLPITPLAAERVQTVQSRLTPFNGSLPTATPLPAPAQTPIFSETIFTGTVAPGS
jgi:hypothetical protein